MSPSTTIASFQFGALFFCMRKCLCVFANRYVGMSKLSPDYLSTVGGVVRALTIYKAHMNKCAHLGSIFLSLRV